MYAHKAPSLSLSLTRILIIQVYMLCIARCLLKTICFVLSLSLFASSRVKIRERGTCVYIVSRDVYVNALLFARSRSLSLHTTSNPRNLATALRLRNVAPFGLK